MCYRTLAGARMHRMSQPLPSGQRSHTHGALSFSRSLAHSFRPPSRISPSSFLDTLLVADDHKRKYKHTHTHTPHTFSACACVVFTCFAYNTHTNPHPLTTSKKTEETQPFFLTKKENPVYITHGIVFLSFRPPASLLLPSPPLPV